MEGSLAVMIPLVGVILSLAIPIVAIIMVFVTAMHKKKQDKEVRQLIIENHTDAETEDIQRNQVVLKSLDISPVSISLQILLKEKEIRPSCILCIKVLLSTILKPKFFIHTLGRDIRC